MSSEARGIHVSAAIHVYENAKISIGRQETGTYVLTIEGDESQVDLFIKSNETVLRLAEVVNNAPSPAW